PAADVAEPVDELLDRDLGLDLQPPRPADRGDPAGMEREHEHHRRARRHVKNQLESGPDQHRSTSPAIAPGLARRLNFQAIIEVIMSMSIAFFRARGAAPGRSAGAGPATSLAIAGDARYHLSGGRRTGNRGGRRGRAR